MLSDNNKMNRINPYGAVDAPGAWRRPSAFDKSAARPRSVVHKEDSSSMSPLCMSDISAFGYCSTDTRNPCLEVETFIWNVQPDIPGTVDLVGNELTVRQPPGDLLVHPRLKKKNFDFNWKLVVAVLGLLFVYAYVFHG
jgi:hypothetical protein